MIEETLRAHAQVVNDMLSTHDTDDFMRRVAARIKADTSRPELPRREAVRDGGPSPEAPVRWAPDPAAPGSPPSFRHRGHRLTRPALHPLRRRPTPVLPVNPSARPVAVLDHVRRLCETVLRTDDVATSMRAFEAHYDEAGARAFACLLYILGRREGALYWWRFAAGAGDPLAAHLLAAHHSAAGTGPQARVWRTHARMLGFRLDRHLPGPIILTAPAETVVTGSALHGDVMQEFMGLEQLPEELLQR